MKEYKIQEHFQEGDEIHSFALPVYEFEEDGVFFVYAPSLDITGYDTTPEGARKSFDIILREFVKFTTSNGTLVKELKRLGWKVKSRKKGLLVTAPPIVDLLRSNRQFKNLLENKDYHTTRKSVDLDLVA